MSITILPKKILSMDIGAHKIKIIIGKKTRKRIILYKFFTINTPEGAIKDGTIVDRDLVHYVIKEELKKRKIKTKDVYITINSSKILTRELIIPKVREEEIESLLMYQVEDYLPVNIDDYVIQYKVLKSFYEGDIEKINLLIIAIPKGIIEDYFNLLKDLGLNPLVMDYQPNSIAKLIQYNSLINNTYPTEIITIANIDIGYDSTRVSIIKEGNILFSRVIDIGGSYIDQSIINFNELDIEELKYLKRNIGDINRVDENKDNNKAVDVIKTSIIFLSERIDMVFRYYLSRETNNEINLILLTGGISNIKGLDNLFSNIFNIPSIPIEDLDNIDFQGEFTDYGNAIGSIIRASGV